MLSIPVLQQIVTTRKVTDEAGNSYDLYADLDPNEGQLLHKLITEYKFSSTLEIGCAYGISSLYICDAISRQPAPRHTIVDPVETTHWHGVGLANLKRAGFNFYELIEKGSEAALPELLAQGRTFQFALIDGFHTFDHVLLDFFYVNRMLEVGGLVAIDDANMPPIRRVGRYVANYPNYKLVGHVGAGDGPSTGVRRSLKRRVVDRGLRGLTKLLPASYVDEAFNASWSRPDYGQAMDHTMLVFQKIGPDDRPWDWYVPF